MAANAECVRMTQEALDLATTAVHFDTSGNIVGAIDYYDKTILALDEVLVHLEPLSAESRLLLARRAWYDERMEVLRQVIDGGGGGGSAAVAAGTSAAAPSTGESKAATAPRRKMRQSFVQFSDLASERFVEFSKNFEAPPKSLVALPYWQMRTIQRTIEHGGLLTPSLCFPQQVWRQHQLKFSGLGVKSAAFQDIVSTINTAIAPLTVPPISDAAAMHKLVAAFSTVRTDFLALQTQLSRSFPFIESGAPLPGASSTSAAAETAAAAADGADEDSAVGAARNLTRMAAGFLMSSFGSMGKNVRKAVETGVFRFNALPASVSEEDFSAFTTLLATLCDKAQLFDSWYTRLDDLRETLVLGNDTVLVEAAAPAAVAQRVSDIEACLAALCHIAVFMRDVVCNMALRDMGMLLERYLNKMRKSFARMQWEMDAEAAAAMTAASSAEGDDA